MKQYELVINNEKQRSYLWFSWLMIIANLAFFIYLSATSRFKDLIPLFYVVVAVILIVVAHYLKRSKIKAAFLIISLGWLNTGAYWWMGILVIILLILEHVAQRRLAVRIFADKIIYPTWPQKEIKWEELNNLVFKDGLLTIDFKSDKLIQQYVVDDDFNEKEFNEFCQQQLNK